MAGYYDIPTVLLSFVLAVLAGFVSMEAEVQAQHSRRPLVWTTTAGCALGLGIWSMHFVGMLAWQPPYPLFYDLDRTILSVLVAIAACSLAMHRAATARGKGVVALLVGLGIAAMHYIGMAAVHFSRPEQWDLRWVAASILIAVGASWMAMQLLGRRSDTALGPGRTILASLLLGAAISGMHYAGMAALMPAPGSVCLRTPGSFSGTVLARAGVGNALLLILGLLVTTYYERARWVAAAGEAQLQAAEAARAVARLAAARRIAASVAAELNNPPEAVTNLLYLVEQGELGGAERRYLAMAQKELDRISEITTHTLKFYRQHGGPEATSIPELFESALVLFRPRIEAAAIEVERLWPDTLPPVVCRAGEMRQVLANLVGNAVDAMKEGGRLRIHVEPEGEWLRVEVADTGQGMTPEVQKRILEPFFTTKGVAGTGLGLSISSEIIARHGGTLTFRSSTEAGASGTAFLVRLPYTGANPAC